jgi:microcystin-dependent protein
MSEPFVGEIRLFPYNFAPRGWTFCQGQLLPIAQNTALFSLLGTTYGGDGRTTLGLPNLQARTAMHEGRGPGLSPRQIGQKGGEPTVTLNAQTMAAHTHAVGASGDDADGDDPGNNSPATTVGVRLYNADSNAQVEMSQSATQGNVGGNGAHNNLMPYQVLNYCIALTGTYPQRG